MERDRVKVSQDVAAAIAHELRNPVFAIASAAQLLRYRIGDDPAAEKNIGRILREAERLNTLTSALLDYARPVPAQLAPGDPDDAWAVAIQTHRGLLESKALLVDYQAAQPRTRCNVDSEQLAQAFENGLTNAIEAAPEGSDLAIDSQITGAGWTTTLRNRGTPINSDLETAAFEPLVSRKPGHAGIGLSVLRRIVTEHGGTVTLSGHDGGTTLTITLPTARID